MKVTLISGPNKNPIDISIGSARTCYSKTLKLPEEISNWEPKINLAKDLLKSGHHTTLQHTYFTFALEDISRLSIWKFFHNHRFYNSDQISQRYAKINSETFYLEDSLNNKEDISNLNKKLIKNYELLIDILEKEYLNSDNKVERKIARKKAMENARYILPQSIFANMYHTINLSVLLRYYSVSESINEATNEISNIINKMVNEVIKEYPETKELFNIVKKEEKKIDILDKNLFNYDKSSIKNVSLFNISENKPIFNGDYKFYSNSTGNYSLFATEETTATFTFKFNLSLSADAQNQRHRTSIGLRPNLFNEINSIKNKEDFIKRNYIPEIFLKNKEAKKIFSSSLIDIFNILKVTDINYAPYLLPNSFLITILETTNFSDFAHKAKMRLCLNAQEEIRYITEYMVESLNQNNIDCSLFVPPCVSRFLSNKKPICPEGDRFCGIKEWKKEKYENLVKF